MKILFIRGAFLNRFEGQNYEPLAKDHQIVGIGSLTSIHKKFDFPVKLFISPYDIQTKLTRGLFNRVLGDSHFLWGFEKFVKQGILQSFNIMKCKYDIGHIAETHYGYDLQAIRLKQGGFIKKVVSTCWETIPFNNETIKKKKRIKEIIKKNTDLFICPTERAKRSLIMEGVSEEKIVIVRVGVDLNSFKILNPKYQIPNKSQIRNSKFKTFHILFVGRLVEEKGVMDLYGAFKNVKCQMSNVKVRLKLRMVSEGNLRKKLIKNIEKDGLESDVLLENRPYKEMPKVYQKADLLIVPSKSTKTWEEQYGMVLVEAMASGLPIVVYRSGAIPEVLGSSGILVNEGDVNGLTKAILTLLDNKDLRIKLGKIGRRRAEKEFDSEKIAKKLGEIYRKLII